MSRADRIAELAKQIGAITAEKNDAYGDSFQNAARVLEILYPEGVKLEQYRDALGVVRVIDKLSRIANRKDAFGESPWRDIAGYGLVGALSDDAQPVAQPGDAASGVGESEPVAYDGKPIRVGDMFESTFDKDLVRIVAIDQHKKRVIYQDGEFDPFDVFKDNRYWLRVTP